MKRCPMCGRALGRECFRPRAATPHLVDAYCRDCMRTYLRAYRQPARHRLTQQADKAQQIVLALRARGLTYAEIARVGHIDGTNVRRIGEGGRNHVWARTLKRLTHVLIVTGGKR